MEAYREGMIQNILADYPPWSTFRKNEEKDT